MLHIVALNMSSLLCILADVGLVRCARIFTITCMFYEGNNDSDSSLDHIVSKPQIDPCLLLCVGCQQGSFTVTMETQLSVLRSSGVTGANFLGFKLGHLYH